MAIPATDDTIAEMVLRGSLNGIQHINVFHFGITVAAGATLQQFGAGLWGTIHDSGLLSLLTVRMVFTSVDTSTLAADGTPVEGEPYIIPAGTGVGGIADEDDLPYFDTWTFKYVNSVVGHRHGFKRFGGVTEGNQVAGLPTGGALGTLIDVAAALSLPMAAQAVNPSDGTPGDPIAGSNATPIILHRMLHGDVLNPVQFDPITTVIFDKIGSQNTRKPGRGS